MLELVAKLGTDCSPREKGEKSDRDLANLGQFQVASENLSLGKAQSGRGGQRWAELAGKEEDCQCYFQKI